MLDCHLHNKCFHQNVKIEKIAKIKCEGENNLWLSFVKITKYLYEKQLTWNA